MEDEPAILKITTRVLERLGYTVVAATGPAEAVRLASASIGDLHLLVTDVVMPEMNGRELAKLLTALHPQIKLLFMSGFTDDVIAHHGVLADGVHFLHKPFSATDLAAKVQDALDSGHGNGHEPHEQA